MTSSILGFTLLSGLGLSWGLQVDIANLLPSSNDIAAGFSSALNDARSTLSRFQASSGNQLSLVSVSAPADESLFAPSVKALLLDSMDNVVRAGIDARDILSIAVNNDQHELQNKQVQQNLFRIVPDASGESLALLELAARFGQKRVIVVHDQSVLGMSALDLVDARAAVLGIDVEYKVPVTAGFDLPAMEQRLTVVATSVVDANGLPNDLGTIIYLGSDVQVFARAWQAASNLNITGSPYTWLVSRVAAQVPAASLASGTFTLGPYATPTQYAHDAVLALASAFEAGWNVLDNDTLLVAAMRAVSFQGQSGFVMFDENQDRPAQFAVYNLQQPSGVWQRVGQYSATALTPSGEGGAPTSLAINAPVQFATGENTPPTYPFARCDELQSCSECSSQPNNKCGWCASTSTCSDRNAAFGSRCAGAAAAASCPLECVTPLPPNVCLFDTNMTIYSPHKARCDAVNGAAGQFPLYREPSVNDNQCQAAFVAERGCQQLVQKLRCSANCQACDGDMLQPYQPRAVCRSTCDALISRHCAATSAACSSAFNTFFASMCTATDSVGCTNATIEAVNLVQASATGAGQPTVTVTTMAGSFPTGAPTDAPTTAPVDPVVTDPTLPGTTPQPTVTLAPQSVPPTATPTTAAPLFPSGPVGPTIIASTTTYNGGLGPTNPPMQPTQPLSPQSVAPETQAPLFPSGPVGPIIIASTTTYNGGLGPTNPPMQPTQPLSPQSVAPETQAVSPQSAAPSGGNNGGAVPIGPYVIASTTPYGGGRVETGATVEGNDAAARNDDDDDEQRIVSTLSNAAFGAILFFVILISLCLIAGLVAFFLRGRRGGPMIVNHDMPAQSPATTSKKVQPAQDEESEISSLILNAEGRDHDADEQRAVHELGGAQLGKQTKKGKKVNNVELQPSPRGSVVSAQ